ncbi:GNAT family N-acetyltransferase [Endozoicomonas sp. Mp262]|uniref:GNAT family N-acetyltransferase n=1 Tax=Endozoicomonas sp. Mp262 TaxID=2919499 RepID=UPI0021DAB6F9
MAELNNNHKVIPVILSNLSANDRQRLMAAINNTWQSHWGWLRYPCPKDFEHEMSEKKHHWLIVKNHDGAFIGGAFCVTHDPMYPDKVYFGTLWTSPHANKAGLGSRLIAYIEEQAKKLGKNGVHIVVNPKLKPLISFYERRGYVLMEKSRQFPGFMRMEKTWDSPEEGHLHRPDKKAISSDQLIVS